MSNKLLVTGASGFIGTHCIIDLLNHGYHVKGIFVYLGLFHHH